MKRIPATALAGFLAFLPITSLQAQEGARGGPGVMLGPTMMGIRGFGMLCSPQAVGFAEWQISRVERTVKPDNEQKQKLNELRSASATASDKIRSVCPREIPKTAPERMELMERRVEAMLNAVKIVRPAFESFYASLSPQQRMRLDATPSRRWNWRFWQRN